ncbi:SMI1/KNR4 family protein [Deinococcus fonticola]|uniref:SMI1/KNR4 family protein n=1 Tax=Deinococcus fonticola TaxID=2528713 RepID=UPI001074C24F|nr:SMI1/KNR4 family protein [Deinococcus fonticola]
MPSLIETASLEDVLARIESWYAAHVPAIQASLRPGVPEEELNDVEARTGLKLPEAYRTLYRWHDGQEFGPGGMFGMTFQSLARVEQVWERWQDLLHGSPDLNTNIPSQSHPPDAIQEAYITRGWLSFLEDGGGSGVGIDLNPGLEGVVGQVINFGRDEQEKYVLADSLDAFLREYLRRLETGRASAVRIEEFDWELWAVGLHEDNGQYVDGYFSLAQKFPGFGASPGLWQR